MASGIVIEDVKGSFAKFIKNAHKTLEKHVETSIDKAAQSVVERMRSAAPVGPDAPHMRDAITYRRRGKMAEIGIFDEEMAQVALFNEYSPNHQPFMRLAAEQSDSDFVRKVTEAIVRMEQALES